MAKQLGISLGLANRTLQSLNRDGYLEEAGQLTGKTMDLLESRKPRRAPP